jgi:hypothetical protein
LLHLIRSAGVTDARYWSIVAPDSHIGNVIFVNDTGELGRLLIKIRMRTAREGDLDSRRGSVVQPLQRVKNTIDILNAEPPFLQHSS